jgi:two-component system chemotaxis response regulator CheB
MHIIIVDKDAQYADLLKEGLTENNEITHFHNSFEALVYLKNTKKPDIIILEINLPGIDGFELLERIRGDADNRAIPVIVVSEYSRDEDIARGKKYEVIEYLSKNNDISHIIQVIKKNLEKINQAKELESKKVSFSGKLEDISIVEVLQIINMSRKTGRILITSRNETAEICMLEGELFSARVGMEEGEAALYIIFSWISGNFNFSKIDLKQFGKNLKIKLHNALLNGTKIIDELNETLELVPYQRNNAGIDEENSKKKFYFNLIDNKSSIKTLINRHHLDKIVAAYYFLQLESEKCCKLINPENIPDGSVKQERDKNKKLNVLIVDDSKVIVRAIKDLLKGDKNIGEIHTSYSGKEALQAIKTNKPDVVTLDVNMPEMNGITTLKHVMLSNPLPVVMLSAFTTQTSNETFDALRYGAVNFHTKPVNMDKESFEAQRKFILEKIKSAAKVNVKGLQYINIKNYKRSYDFPPSAAENIILIAAPTASYGTLLQIIPALPANLNAAVVVLHYIEGEFIDAFIKYLNKVSEMKSTICSGGGRLLSGNCYFVSQQYYSKYTKGEDGVYINLNEKPFSENHEHSINIGMFSAAETFGANSIAVLISGKTEDGIEGLNEIKRYGGYTIAQSPESCVIPDGAIAAIKNNSVMEVIATNKISKKLISCLKKDITS